MVLDKGFAWGRPNLGSLSQVAKAVTGTSWNGYRFLACMQWAKVRSLTWLSRGP